MLLANPFVGNFFIFIDFFVLLKGKISFFLLPRQSQCKMRVPTLIEILMDRFDFFPLFCFAWIFILIFFPILFFLIFFPIFVLTDFFPRFCSFWFFPYIFYPFIALWFIHPTWKIFAAKNLDSKSFLIKLPWLFSV